MNEYLLSVILGIIEGLTEFLPVSSTAHLRIAEAMSTQIRLDDPYWKMYTVVIQLGAILAVVVFFWKRLMKFIATFPRGEKNDHTLMTHPLMLVMVAFVCTAIPALLLKKRIHANLENLWVIGASLLVGGVVMWVVDVMCQRVTTPDIERMSLPQAIWVGLVQILSAVFPGTSRSMSTIAAGQTVGLSRSAALDFSFFLCIPTMIAATGKELWDTIGGMQWLKGLLGLHRGGSAEAQPATQAILPYLHMTSHQWVVLAIGFVVSFLVAWAVIAWFIAWVRKHGFVPFAIYRIVLGLAVLIWQLNRG